MLLEPHRCYYRQLKPLLREVKGLAHITGGGLPDNVPRVLPEGLTARFNSRAWEIPPVFGLLQRLGGVERDEMYHVFNMGIGMVVFCAPEKVKELSRALPGSKVIGEVLLKEGKAGVIIE